MKFGRTLLIMFALLAYLGQSMAFAMPVCDAMGDAGAGAQQPTVMMDSEHMHHEMEPQQAKTQQQGDCCGSQCLCLDQGCHSPVTAISSSNVAAIFSAVGHDELQALGTISNPFYLYKPPILS